MNEEIKNTTNSTKKEKIRSRHISEKKKGFSVKKISRFIFFIIILIVVVICSNKATKSFMDIDDEKIIRKMFEKMEEDKNISNFYEKKRWDVNVVRETWRKDDNYLIKDTYDSGEVSYTYYVDGIYYVIRDIKDDINGVTTKRVTKMTNMGKKLPNPGMQDMYVSNNDVESDIEEWAREATIKSTKMEGIKCYQIYIKRANETYFVDKSSYRVIREIKLYKETDDDNINAIDTGIIEIKTDTVTDEDIALPDFSGYEVSEIDVRERLESEYNKASEESESESEAIEDIGNLENLENIEDIEAFIDNQETSN